MVERIDSSLTNLKQIVVIRAQTALRRANPRYVAAFQAHMTRSDGDLAEAIAAAEPLRAGVLANWSKLLSLLFDMDLAALKVSEALRRLRAARDGSDFEDFEYHGDHWIFQFDAYLERSKKALMACTRQLLDEPQRKAAVVQIVKSDLDNMRAAIAKMRDELAHGSRDGTDAVTPFWAPFLAMADPPAFSQIFVATVKAEREPKADAERMTMRLAVSDHCSAQAFARIENLARAITEAIT